MQGTKINLYICIANNFAQKDIWFVTSNLIAQNYENSSKCWNWRQKLRYG